MTSGSIFKNGALTYPTLINAIYHERERNNKENANFVHIVHLLAKLFNIFDEAFLLTSVYILMSHI